MEDIRIIPQIFADVKPPEIKETPNKDWILFGEKNDYPEYLLYLYNKSAKHRAIINAKVNYILGSGLQGFGGFAKSEVDGVIQQPRVINDAGETMHDVLKKSIKDLEIYGGFRWKITADKLGRVSKISHVDFRMIRRAKDKTSVDKKGNTIKTRGYYYCDKWFNADGTQNYRAKPDYIPEFTGYTDGVKLSGHYIFAFDEHNPSSVEYPLPNYMASNNYIDLDVEISKFHLSAIRNGMIPSKMIQFFTGEPDEEGKKNVEKRIKGKFSGAENGGNFFLVFNKKREEEVKVDDLSATELDKQFELLGKTVTQEIITGHQVVSPMLFGIKTEGQLGGASELKIAYEIFMNTYAKPKQDDILLIVNWFGKMMNRGESYEFMQLDPVGIIFDAKDYVDIIPKEFVLERLGIPKQFITPAQQTTPAAQPNAAPGEQPVAQAADVNENIKNLTGRQFEQVTRIIRNFTKGKITKETAQTMLRVGYGLTEEDINVLLGIADPEEVELAKQVSMIEHRQNEIDEAVRPVLKLNYITDKSLLSKRIKYPVADGSGQVIEASLTIGKLQAKIKQQMDAIEKKLNDTYAA